jgi:hypothetical protein
MSVSEEIKGLYSELWMWRAFGLLILVLFITLEAFKWRDLAQHSTSVEVYQTLELEKKNEILKQLNKNWTGVRDVSMDIRKVNENIYECLRCHAHPQSLVSNWNLPRREDFQLDSSRMRSLFNSRDLGNMDNSGKEKEMKK